MNKLNKRESAVFLYCRFSLFLKDSFFILFRFFSGPSLQNGVCHPLHYMVQGLRISDVSVDMEERKGPQCVLIN